MHFLHFRIFDTFFDRLSAVKVRKCGKCKRFYAKQNL